MASDPDYPREPAGADKAVEAREFRPVDDAPPDAGEPMGARDDRPSMLGNRFRLTMVAGMVVGLALALLGHALFADVFIARDPNGWSWLLAAIGGVAVGGALTLFLYGVSTDRTDTGPKRRGRADVTTEGEDSRGRRRRRRAARSH